MKNLKLREVKRIRFPRKVKNVNSLVYANNGHIFFIEDNKLFYFDNTKEVIQICEIEQCRTDLIYLVSLDIIWFGTGNSFVFINPESFEVKTIDIQCTFVTASWSPNNEIIAVCHEDGKIQCYGVDFIHFTLLPVKNFNEEYNTSLIKDVTDNFKPEIVWKNNSQYFTVCYFEDNYRLCIYKSNGEEPVVQVEIPNLLPCISWRHGMIVCARKIDTKCSINMYERNGLFHSEFMLDNQVKDVHQMQWNENGDVSVVHVTTTTGSFLNIYTFISFKYQLKQQIKFTTDNPLTRFKFNGISKHIINLIIINTEDIVFHKYGLTISNGILPNKLGFYAEVDSDTLKLQGITGDDMAGKHEEIVMIQVKHPLTAFAFDNRCNICVVIDSHNNIYVYNIDGKVMKIAEKIVENDGDRIISLYNPCFISENRVTLVCLSNDGYHLYEFDVRTLDMTMKKLNKNIIYMKWIPERQCLLNITETRELYLNDEPLIKNYSFMIELIQIEYVILNDILYIITLNELNQLCINQQIIGRNVSSFILHSNYLFITSNVNKLFCIPINNEEITRLCKESLNSTFFSRDCEDNSIVLFGVPKTKYVLLYHPRGNTETILCRNVALDQLKLYIDQKNWKDAFEFIRIERLDPNLLIDIDPDAFLRDVKLIIDSIDAPNLIQVLLLSLSDTNVLTTTYKKIKNVNIKEINDKKKVICESILEILVTDMKKYIKPVMVAASVINGVNGAIEYLHTIFKMYGDIENIITNGLNCLKLYIPIEDIRKACLSRIDIEFARCIFAKLNIDPKLDERLFSDINSNTLNVYKQSYLVHNYIENYKDALQYLLVSCMYQKTQIENYDDESDVREIIEYAETNRLITELYKYCLKYDFHNEKILNVYTDKLQSEARYEESAIIFSHNKMWMNALNCYLECCKWEEAMRIIDRLDLNDSETWKYISGLAKTLQLHGKHREAVDLYRRYLNDSQSAINSLINGRYYEDAIQCGYQSKELNLIETSIVPDYQAYYTTLLEKINTASNTFKQYFDRLQIIRDADNNPGQHGSGDGGDVSHQYAESMAGSLRSGSTFRSRSSGYSSRTRREERRKQDLREGGFYENIALMRALHNLIQESYGLCLDVKNLCSLYMTFEHDFPKAKQLQDSLANLLHNIECSTSTIWPANLNSVNIPITRELTNLRKNLDELDMKYRYPPEITKVAWKFDILDELIEPINNTSIKN